MVGGTCSRLGSIGQEKNLLFQPAMELQFLQIPAHSLVIILTELLQIYDYE
jgi:hypothetical protein